MKVRRLTGFVGAEVEGADPEDPSLVRLLDDHLVLHLRRMHLDLPAQKRLTQMFGPLMQLPYVEPIEGEPDVIAVLKEADERAGGVFGGAWHSDFSFLDNPPAGSVLNAVEVPEVGGDTVFASQIVAWESLPDHLKSHLDGREAIHVGAPYGVKHAPPEDARSGASIRMTRGDPAADRETRHPAVVRHPRTGRRALNLNPIYTTRLSGLSEAESAPILRDIWDHATRPDFQCRIRWRAGDVAIWDNRMVLHYATNDYDGSRRLLYRTAWAGERPATG